MNPVFRMQELIGLIQAADKAYFGKDDPIMTDKEYDALVEELVALEKQTGLHFNNSPIGRVGGEVKAELTPVTHTKPMLSCNKTKKLEDIVAFIRQGDIVLSWKMDGLTLVLRYENGEFRQAITRGADGLVGEDVTHTVREMRNIPFHVPCHDPFEVRGEGVLSFADYALLGRLGCKSSHPRNVAAGAVRSMTADPAKLYHMDFVAFELIKSKKAPRTKVEQLKFLEENHFKVVEHCEIHHDDSDKNILALIDKWAPTNFAYPVDGLVAEYNDIAFGKRLGATAHHEKRMLALKWSDEIKKTVFRGVTLNTTRNGTVSIVGEFDEVTLDGTKIHRANLHNLSHFEKFAFGEGDAITVYKANRIIPQIADNLTRSGTYLLPDYCPSCGEELMIQVSEGGVRNLYCPNEDCVARHANRIARYCDRHAMDIDGFSVSTVEKMIAYGWIKNFPDLYHLDLHEEAICGTPGFGPERYAFLQEQIQKSRCCRLYRFLTGLGIPRLGEEGAKQLHQYYYGSMEAFEDAIREGFSFHHIEGISQKVNESIHQWYQKPANQNLLHALMAELTFEGTSVPTQENGNPFLGKTVAVTGTFERMERNTLISLLESLGAMIAPGVTRDTDYLLFGNLPGSKKVGAAVANGITMINERQFAEMLEQNR